MLYWSYRMKYKLMAQTAPDKDNKDIHKLINLNRGRSETLRKWVCL